MGLSPKRREIDKKRRQKWVRSKIIARRRSHPESSESNRGPQLAKKQGVLRVIGQCGSSVQNILSTYLARSVSEGALAEGRGRALRRNSLALSLAEVPRWPGAVPSTRW